MPIVGQFLASDWSRTMQTRIIKEDNIHGIDANSVFTVSSEELLFQ
jgi:hypothetical protein